jgi:translation initiation factor 3 subunit B
MVAAVEPEIDVSSIDFSDLEKQFAVEDSNAYVNTVLIVDNVPLVDDQKRDKLVNVLRKVIGKMGKLKEGDDGLYMPMSEDPKKPGKNISKG